MTLHAPLFCAICAVPCLLPRKSTSELADTSPTADLVDDTSDPARRRGWRNDWQVLQATHGLFERFTIIPASPCHHNANSSSHSPGPSDLSGRNCLPVERSKPSAYPIQPKQDRCIPLHTYCLEAILRTTRQSMFNTGSSHEVNMLLGWSLPKWTGWGPWVDARDRGGSDVAEGVERRGWVDYWGRTADQRTKFAQAANERRGVDGDHPDRCQEQQGHLIAMDHVSPLIIPPPSTALLPSPTPASSPRPIQSSALLSLPDHILSLIAQYVVGPTGFLHSKVAPSEACISGTKTDPSISTVPPRRLPSFASDHPLNLLHASHGLYHLHLPSSLWRYLTMKSAERWMSDIMKRWRANPTGVGSASQLWIALDEEFIVPLQGAVAASVPEGTFDRTEIGKGLDPFNTVTSIALDKHIDRTDHTMQREMKMAAQENKPCSSACEGSSGLYTRATPVTARDTFMWWTFSPAWRSRRRIWYCAVHAAATARDADWW